MSDPTDPTGPETPGPEPLDPLERAAQPVIAAEKPLREKKEPDEGVGLCLSGGGYRAMLFHLGTLWRLNELGWLPKLNRVSSVSGGSITAGVLAVAWRELRFDRAGVAADFGERVVKPLRRLAGVTVDVPSVLGGLLPGGTIGDRVVKAYREHLFGDRTLQDLPDEAPGTPRFIFNATSVQTGSLWRFSKEYMADWQVGEVRRPEVLLAVAVAASSAFPPVLSPLVMHLDPGAVQPFPGSNPPYFREPFTTRVVLTDGGVYDNLGLETVWKNYRTVLVSDGGMGMEAQPRPRADWAMHTFRVLNLIDNQVRALRKRQVVGSFKAKEREGSFWRIPGDIADYSAPGKLPCPLDRTQELAATPTRLAKMKPLLQERLINWGYALCDAAMRTHVDPSLPAPADFPYPAAKV